MDIVLSDLENWEESGTLQKQQKSQNSDESFKILIKRVLDSN